jgi:hypothetical protein
MTSKAIATSFGDPKDCLFPQNDHMDYYDGWLYLGKSFVDNHRSDGKAIPCDVYYKKTERSYHGEWISFVEGSDPWEYASPDRNTLHLYGRAGERILEAQEEIKKHYE